MYSSPSGFQTHVKPAAVDLEEDVYDALLSMPSRPAWAGASPALVAVDDTLSGMFQAMPAPSSEAGLVPALPPAGTAAADDTLSAMFPWLGGSLPDTASTVSGGSVPSSLGVAAPSPAPDDMASGISPYAAPLYQASAAGAVIKSTVAPSDAAMSPWALATAVTAMPPALSLPASSMPPPPAPAAPPAWGMAGAQSLPLPRPRGRGGSNKRSTPSARKSGSKAKATPAPPDAICVRCEQTQKRPTNSLRRVTYTLARRVQSNLAFLESIDSTPTLRRQLLANGHSENLVNRWLKAIHQKPGRFVARLKHVETGVWVHKKCQDCLSLLLRTTPEEPLETAVVKKQRNTDGTATGTTFTSNTHYSDPPTEGYA